LQIGPAIEVIFLSMTFFGFLQQKRLVMVGAKPYFLDLTDQDGLLASDWDRAITSKTKAVIPVSPLWKDGEYGKAR